MSDVRAGRVVSLTLSAVLLCAWCGWASGFHHSTMPAFAGWSASIAAVVVIDTLFWRGRRHRRFALPLPPAGADWPRVGRGGAKRALLGVTPWLVLVGIVLIWELLGIDTGQHEPHLTVSALAQAFRPFNAALMLVWLLVGLGYGAARARAPVSSVRNRPAHDVAAGAFVAVGRHPALLPALLLPQSRAAGVAFWSCIVVLAVVVNLASRRSRGVMANAEEFIRLISRPRLANLLLIAAWGFAGWHLFAH